MTQGIMQFDISAAVGNAGQCALMDERLRDRLARVRTDPIIKDQGEYFVAEMALRWAQEAFKEAQEAALCPIRLQR